MAFAQNEVAIGEWRSYLPYTKGIDVTQNATTIYYAANFSLLAIDKEDNSIQRLTKVNGLSDVEISKLKHSPFNDILIAVYENRNIDFITPDEITNFPFVKDKNVPGDQSINEITFVAPERVFLSTGFGLLEMNPETVTVQNDIRTGIPVKSFAAFDGSFFAATEEGIYTIEDTPNANLLDFSNNWRLLDESDGFPLDYSSNVVYALDDQLVVDVNDSLFFYKDGLQNSFFGNDGFSFEFVSAEGEHMIVGLECNGCNDRIAFLTKSGTFIRDLGISCVSNVQNAVQDEQGRIWIADRAEQFRTMKTVNSSCAFDIFEGPASGNIWDIEVKGNELWVATGGFSTTREYLFRRDGILRLKEDGFWEQYTICLLYTSPSPRDATLSRMPSSA